MYMLFSNARGFQRGLHLQRAAVAAIRAMPGAAESGLPLFYTVKEFTAMAA
jgi:hypothetical protein